MAQRATSPGPKPSLFYLFFLLFVFFFFLSLLLLEKNPVSPPKKGIFVYFFCVSLCFSLALFHFIIFFVFLISSSFLFPSFLFLSFLFLVLAFSFCFVYFRCSLVSVVLLVVLLCLNHNLSFVFALHILSSFCSCFLFCLLWFFLYFLILGNQTKNIFKKNGN